MRLGCQPSAQPQVRNLFGQGDPAISNTVTSIALEIIGSHKLHHHKA